ncbi:MAG: hypothetical protein ACLP4R_10250 [Solirubrobacteraceae bacterium]
MRITIILSLLAAAVGVAACGSSDPSTTAAASNSSTGKNASGLAFASCVRAHGVPNFPDPTSNGQGGIQIQQSQRSGSGPTTSVNGVPVNGPAFQGAMKDCQHYLANGGHPSAAQTAELKAKALAMSRCMRSHGVPNFPDPTFQSGPGGGVGVGIKIGNGSGIDPSSPAFQAAQKECGSIFGGPKVAGGPTP